MKNLDILVAFDMAAPPPADHDYTEYFRHSDWYTEAAVVETLRLNGHAVRTIGIFDSVQPLLAEVERKRPDIVFNLVELFANRADLDKNIPALLELLKIPYTGCGPLGMALCNNKAMTKKILSFHRIKVPDFQVFRPGHRVWLPKKLSFPLIVKPLREEASTGISQGSYVTTEEQFQERIRFIHDKFAMAALAERYIEGRELYVGILGHHRLRAFPIREMVFRNVPDDQPRIATYKAKWDKAYREKWGIDSRFADDLDNGTARKIVRACKRAYRALNMDSYARFDCRLTPDGDVYILEGNANPELANADEFAEAAERVGLLYIDLLHRIIQLGLTRG